MKKKKQIKKQIKKKKETPNFFTSTIHKLTKLINSITQPIRKKLSVLYYREEEPEYTLPKSWKKTNSSETQDTLPETAFHPKKPITTHKIRRERIHIPLLRTTKQITAAILFLLDGLVGLAGLSSANPGMGFFFLLNSFICLDYLWKMSHWRIIQEEE